MLRCEIDSLRHQILQVSLDNVCSKSLVLFRGSSLWPKHSLSELFFLHRNWRFHSSATVMHFDDMFPLLYPSQLSFVKPAMASRRSDLGLQIFRMWQRKAHCSIQWDRRRSMQDGVAMLVSLSVLSLIIGKYWWYSSHNAECAQAGWLLQSGNRCWRSLIYNTLGAFLLCFAYHAFQGARVSRITGRSLALTVSDMLFSSTTVNDYKAIVHIVRW
jgi:hypothetical protein